MNIIRTHAEIIDALPQDVAELLNLTIGGDTDYDTVLDITFVLCEVISALGGHTVVGIHPSALVDDGDLDQFRDSRRGNHASAIVEAYEAGAITLDEIQFAATELDDLLTLLDISESIDASTM